jgi:hypothetical protein
VPGVIGRREARASVERIIDYTVTSLSQGSFDYVSFYAPTFTLNRSWVVELCDRINLIGESIRWKCCTTLQHLDEELIQKMGEAGCVRISVGLETLEDRALEALPAAKKRGAGLLQNVAGWCLEAGIELNCFVVLGLPHTSARGSADSIRAVHELGARTRPTIYADWSGMRPGLSEGELVRFNRQILPDDFDGNPAEREQLYRLLVGLDG